MSYQKHKGKSPITKQKQYPVVDVTVMEARSDAVKNNITQVPGMLGP